MVSEMYERNSVIESYESQTIHSEGVHMIFSIWRDEAYG